MKVFKKRPLLKSLVLGVIVCAQLSGCTDSLSGSHEPAESVKAPATHDQSKFRNAELVDRALTMSTGKDGDESTLELLVGVADFVLDKQRVIERYKTLERFRVIERYEFSETFDGFAVVIIDSLGTSAYDAFFQLLLDDPDIAWFEPDISIDMPISTTTSGHVGQVIPWSVAMIGGRESFAASGNGAGQIPVDVYILDSGISAPDLNVVSNVDFRNGPPETIAPRYLFDTDLLIHYPILSVGDGTAADPSDNDGHGTHIGGIIGAVDDYDGIVGVAPGARLHNYKVLDDNGTTESSVVIAAIEHVLSQKQLKPSTPMVINMSLGEHIGTTAYTALDYAVQAAIDGGVVCVVAAGNHGEDASLVTPAHVEGAITVGSNSIDGQYSWFSNYGEAVDIIAPGEGIISLSPSAKSTPFVEMSGTSMATAHVSGAVALLLSRRPSATAAQIEAALLASARPFIMNTPAGTTDLMVWVGVESVRDEVSTSAYGGNDGSRDWSTAWIEAGENDGAASGSLQAIPAEACPTSGCLRLGDSDSRNSPVKHLLREVDLSGATSALLTYDYSVRRRKRHGSVSVSVSGNGGTSWSQLASYVFNDGSSSGSETFDISQFIGPNTQLKFEMSQGRVTGHFYADDITIRFDQ